MSTPNRPHPTPVGRAVARRRRVLIVGAGIAGLTLSRALAADGHEVTVVERAAAWEPLGAGITLAGNAMAVLDRLGLGHDVRAAGRRMSGGSILDALGRPLMPLGPGPDDPYPTLADMWALHRAELHAALVAGASAADVRLGTSVLELDHRRDGVIARLEDGSEHEYDLVVGADGIRSRVRALALGAAAPAPRYAGYTCWRLVVPDRVGLEAAFEQWGRGARIGGVPLTDGRLYLFLVADAPAGGADGAAPVEELQRRFAAFGGTGGATIAALAPSDTLLRHDIHELPAPVWGAGRVVLVGDAAHAMTPNLGQGAAQAIEDAYALRLALAREADDAAAAHAYRSLRQARVGALMGMSRRVGRVALVSNRLTAGLRDAALRATPRGLVLRNLDRSLAPGLRLAEG